MLRGDEPMAVICNRHGVSATQAYRWLDRFLEGGRKALTDRRRGNGRDPLGGEFGTKRFRDAIAWASCGNWVFSLLEALSTSENRLAIATVVDMGNPGQEGFHQHRICLFH